MAHVRTALADVVRGLEAGTLPCDRGRVLVYALSTIAQVISEGDVERRLGLLEAQMGVRQ